MSDSFELVFVDWVYEKPVEKQVMTGDLNEIAMCFESTRQVLEAVGYDLSFVSPVSSDLVADVNGVTGGTIGSLIARPVRQYPPPSRSNREQVYGWWEDQRIRYRGRVLGRRVVHFDGSKYTAFIVPEPYKKYRHYTYSVLQPDGDNTWKIVGVYDSQLQAVEPILGETDFDIILTMLDCKQGIPQSNLYCPLALALRRMFPLFGVQVGSFSALIFTKSGADYRIFFPDELRRVVNLYDVGQVCLIPSVVHVTTSMVEERL